MNQTLEQIYKDNILEKKDELPLDDLHHAMYLFPNGDYWQKLGGHTNSIADYLTPDQKHEDFLRENKLIHIHLKRLENNRIDFVILAPITKAQLKTIYRTYKVDPTLWITYDVVDLNKPFSYSGDGYRNLLVDLRKAGYLTDVT